MNMPIFSLKDLLPISINKAGIKTQLEASQVCLAFNKCIRELNNPNFKEIKPLSFKNHVITISCPSSSHAQEFLMHQHLIKQKINQHFQKQLVDRFQYQINFIA